MRREAPQRLYAGLPFQFTHPGRGATKNCQRDARDSKVSIHAPREGCDSYRQNRLKPSAGFNSRTPGGVRLSLVWAKKRSKSFNSRTPGGVRHTSMIEPIAMLRFNSRTPGGVRLLLVALPDRPRFLFQFTHPGRGATASCFTSKGSTEFQFTHPGRGATSDTVILEYLYDVSIHAPREGCDPSSGESPLALEGFNSRTPGGVRLQRQAICVTSRSFNSRTPGGVRRGDGYERLRALPVSIHAPREGCDLGDFFGATTSLLVSIHAPREGCDLRRASRSTTTGCFNSRTPGGVRLVSVSVDYAISMFQFTHPGRGATTSGATRKG